MSGFASEKSNTWRGQRRGRAALAALSALLAILVAILAVWFASQSSSPAPLARESSRTQREVGPSMLETQASLDGASDVRAAAARAAEAPAPRSAVDPGLFAGHVTVRARNPDGSEFGGGWTLHREPGVLPREPMPDAIDVGTGPRTIELAAPASLRLWAQASGARSRLGLVVVDAQHPATEVVLVLETTGRVAGTLVGDDGAALAAMEVSITDDAWGWRSATQSNALGQFELDGVLDGPSTLAVGALEAPIVTRSLRAHGPVTQLEPVNVPRLYELGVRVLDEDGIPAAGALVRGRAAAHGAIRCTTDERGLARAQQLPAGHYRLHATRGLFGASVEREIDVPIATGTTDKTESPIELRLVAHGTPK